MKFRSILFTCLSLLLLWSCSTDFEVYAPEKEIRSVYCVLRADDTVQYVRLARAFQFKGDVIEYIRDNDLSLSGKVVKLSSGNKTWTAVEETISKDSGAFYPSHRIYKFITDGSGPGKDTLIEGNTYKLEVGAPEDPDYIFGETVIPQTPRIKGELSLVAAAGSSKCLPRLALERKFVMYWTRSGDGVNYEVRVGMEFERNGVPQETAIWGPTELFSSNSRCNEGSGNICYQFGQKELLRAFFRNMPEEPGVSYTYETTDSCVPNPTLLHLLPKSLWFEVTAVDINLSNYMTVNNPQFLDLTGTRPEYTNLKGNIDVLGVFGSICTDIRYAILTPCGEGLLGLNGQPIPAGCSWD